MNRMLREFAEAYLMRELPLLPESWQRRFKQLYAKGRNLEIPIEEIIITMSDEKLNRAMEQVKVSREKLANREM